MEDITDKRYALTALRRTGTNEMSAKVTINRSSPWFSGHFPGDPILPGIAQLDMVTEVISVLRQEKLILTGLSRVKFRKLIRPGKPMDIHAAADKKDNHYTFRITCQGEAVCSGMMILAKKDATTAL